MEPIARQAIEDAFRSLGINAAGAHRVVFDVREGVALYGSYGPDGKIHPDPVTGELTEFVTRIPTV